VRACEERWLAGRDAHRTPRLGSRLVSPRSIDSHPDPQPPTHAELFEWSSGPPESTPLVLAAGVTAVTSSAVLSLARAGVARFRLADAREVALCDVSLDIAASVRDIGRPRVKSLAEAVLLVNPTAAIDIALTGVTEDNAGRMVEDVACIVSGFSRQERTAVLWLEEAARHAGVPIVAGSSRGFATSIWACPSNGASLSTALGASSTLRSRW